MTRVMPELHPIANFRRGAAARLASSFPEEPINEVVRKRLIHARNLNRLDQIEASQLLGYKNSSALSKVESGFAKIPKDFLIKAAKAYGVSMDYLMGLHDEPERDPETAERMAILRAVREQIAAQNDRMVTVLLANAADMTPMQGYMSSLLTSMNKCFLAFDTVCRRNSQFEEDVIAGSTLQSAIDEAHAVVQAANKFMERRQALVSNRVNMSQANSDEGMLDLFGGQ
ncbi:helix-turn-helix domain-containing protein [Undibacterium crateris]|uniref:helix-turn-helix domain-containing protein n=1 Tax=Undibacterium crateris TaxID=2528175 RepID=UPI001389C3AC|nr:helix-turn-helix transcriptional regulator [Undibacterium crateris]NDI85107.1 helix-turn-helix domain-containing protein [Undibacterium crateris]